MSRDDCVRVISSQEDQTCHLIGHQYAAGEKTCLSLNMTQWMKLWSNRGGGNWGVMIALNIGLQAQ